MKHITPFFFGFTLLPAPLTVARQEQPLPVIPIGVDAYLKWDRWHQQRIGLRAYMRSTYDRSGGNETADASHFLYQESDDFNVSLDVEGSGILVFARYNHWHGSPWHYEVDGRDYLVMESTSLDPDHPVPASVFLPEKAFPPHLTWTWSTTKGADLMWVPIPFEKRFRMAYTRTHYGTGYYIYHQVVDGTSLSRPIESWNDETVPPKAILDLLKNAGTDIAPTAITTQRKKGLLTKTSPQWTLFLPEGPTLVRAVKLRVPQEKALLLDDARITFFWDERRGPSVDAPVSLFFGTGTLYNREKKEFLIKALPVNIRFEGETVELACYFPMPFFKSGKMGLSCPDLHSDDLPFEIEVRSEALDQPPGHVGLFHATYRDHPEPKKGLDLTLLDTQGVEGEKDWSGTFVGTSFIFSHRGVLSTLEGDPRFFFDDSQTPQCYGTGTEEWGGGGDYWGGRTMTLPLAGHPVGCRRPSEAQCDKDLIQSAYRFLLADLMPFGKRAVIRLEHGGVNESEEHYETVTYWYGIPSPSLVLTDTLDVGDVKSEREHQYESPEASAPYELSSRFEWGVDTLKSAAERRPAAHPSHYAEFEFEASADIPYTIWVHGRALQNNNRTDSFWVQFDEEIGTDQVGEDHYGPFGMGNWLDSGPSLDYRWSSGRPQDPPLSVTFQKKGVHRMRIQPRHGGHRVDQIWLSATQRKLPADQGAVPAARSGAAKEIVLQASEATLFGERRKKEEGILLRKDDDSSEGLALELHTSSIEVFPEQKRTGRHTRGSSEFTISLRPDNVGILLRRTLDYAFPNQRAEVYVRDPDLPGEEWAFAGIWYLAGSNTCVFSNPPEELGKTQHLVQTSNRRLRDDEFLVSRKLTMGKSSLRLKIVFTPVERPLFPGHPLPELAWSELDYQVYCFVVPSPG